MSKSNDTPSPTSVAATKEARAREFAQATKEYEAERLATLAKTERLRALRLANGNQVAPQPKGKVRLAKTR